MTRNEEIDLEIRQQALRLWPRCTALFELPMMRCRRKSVFAKAGHETKQHVRPRFLLVNDEQGFTRQ